MSLSCTVSDVVCEVTAYVTTSHLEKYFRSNAAVEVAAKAIVLISFYLGNV